MHIAAMILGILGGLSLLGVSFLGYSIGAGADSFSLKVVSLAIPIFAFVGAGVVMKNGLFGGILMLISAAGVLLTIGMNVFGIFFSMLLIIGGTLGVMSAQGRKAPTAASLMRRQELVLPMLREETVSQTLREEEVPKRKTIADISTRIDTPLPPESKTETTPPPAALTPKGDGTPKSLYLAGGLIAAGLLGYFGLSFYENKQELGRLRVEKETLERNAQQEAAARWAAEQQTEAERRARQEAAAREAEAQRRAQEEGEARRNAQAIEAQRIAREQATAERKANLEIEAQRQYQHALAQLEKSYQYSQDDAKKRHAYGLARATGRPERIASAEKAYHDRLARAQKRHVEKRAQADVRYQDALAQIMRVYGPIKPNGQSQQTVTAQTAALQTKVTGGADLSATAPSNVPNSNQFPADSVDIPAVKVGDTYVVISQYPQNTKLNNTTQRKVISVVDGEIAVASRNVRSTSDQARILRFTREWNLVSSRNADGSGLDYAPPLKCFEFPLYPGKTQKCHTRAQRSRL